MEPHFANDAWAERENRMTRFPLIASQYLSNLLAKMQDSIIYTTSSNILYFHHDIWKRTLEARAGIAYNSSQEYPVHVLRSSIMLKVRAKYLLLIAAAVWFLAGVNIMRLGIIACLEGDAAIWLLVIGIPVVFVVFHCMFSKLVGKHADRIRGYGEDKMHVLRFFDVKGYVIMAIMMGGGISLRAFGIVPGMVRRVLLYGSRHRVGPGRHRILGPLHQARRRHHLPRHQEDSPGVVCYVLRPVAAATCQAPRNFPDLLHFAACGCRDLPGLAKLPGRRVAASTGRTCISRASR